MGGALDELSMVASTVVGATVELYKRPVPQELRGSLSDFLSAALDQMAASVSLINGRLPLDCSEEALQEVARCARLPNAIHRIFHAFHVQTLRLTRSNLHRTGICELVAASQGMTYH